MTPTPTATDPAAPDLGADYGAEPGRGFVPRPGRILVVDDDADIRALISAILSRAGYIPEAVNGGIPALAAAHRRAPELYVLDVDMPVMNGLDLCQRLKADHRTDAPVLIVSANASAEAIAAGLAASADAYLLKPFTRRDLLDRVNALLRGTLAA